MRLLTAVFREQISNLSHRNKNSAIGFRHHTLLETSITPCVVLRVTILMLQVDFMTFPWQRDPIIIERKA